MGESVLLSDTKDISVSLLQTLGRGPGSRGFRFDGLWDCGVLCFWWSNIGCCLFLIQVALLYDMVWGFEFEDYVSFPPLY
jgi:hypothetical protein